MDGVQTLKVLITKCMNYVFEEVTLILFALQQHILEEQMVLEWTISCGLVTTDLLYTIKQRELRSGGVGVLVRYTLFNAFNVTILDRYHEDILWL